MMKICSIPHAEVSNGAMVKYSSSYIYHNLFGCIARIYAL